MGKAIKVFLAEANKNTLRYWRDVLLAEDKFRDGSTTIVVVGTETQLSQIEARVLKEQPDILVSDIIFEDYRLGQLDGLDRAFALQNQLQTLGVVIITASESASTLHRFRELQGRSSSQVGSAYLIKQPEEWELPAVLHTVARGNNFYDPRLAERVNRLEKVHALTSEEITIIELMREGCKNKRIAALLAERNYTPQPLSQDTIQRCISYLYQQFDIDTWQLAAEGKEARQVFTNLMRHILDG